MGWITDLLKEIPSAARYKSELEQLESEHGILKTENAVLQSKLKAAEEKIRNLEKQLSERREQRLEAIRESILQLLIRRPQITHLDIAENVSISPELALFHLEEMQEAEFVDTQGVQLSEGESPAWHVEQKGRQYLVAHGLLK